MAVIAACDTPEELYTTILIDKSLCPVGELRTACHALCRAAMPEAQGPGARPPCAAGLATR